MTGGREMTLNSGGGERDGEVYISKIPRSTSIN